MKTNERPNIHTYIVKGGIEVIDKSFYGTECQKSQN